MHEHFPGQPEHTGPDSPDRRRLLTWTVAAPTLSVAAGFGLAPIDARALALPLTPPDTTDVFDLADAIALTSAPTMPLVRLTVQPDGRVRLELPRAEVGQGISTAAAMMVAEELDVPLSMVDVPLSDARPELVFNQLSGGSAAVRSLHVALPVLAATARARLVAAAAQRFGVSASTLVVANGRVSTGDGRVATYGELGAQAALVPSPTGVAPKPRSAHRVVGTAAPRIDARDIVTGRKKFTMDLDVPGALPTMMRMPSQIRGRVVSVNNLGTVRSMPGVVEVVVVQPGGNIVPRQVGVAVMAETFGQAWNACMALDITWGAGPLNGETNETIQAKLKRSILPFALPPLGALTVEGEFEMPPAAHAPLETECAIVDARGNRCEIWAPLQSPIITQQAIAADLGLPQSAVVAHCITGGGSFGRRLFWDPVQVAAFVSRTTGRICKLMYHRSDDMRQTRVRPPQYQRIRATALLGNVIAYEQRIASPRLDGRHGFGEMLTAAAGAIPGGMPNTAGNLGVELTLFKTMVAAPYNWGVHTKELLPFPLDMNTVSYRSVHIQPARATEEIMVDELARAMRKDPVAFRLEHLRMARARAVLQRCAQAAGWGRAMPAGFAQGVAVHQETRSFTAAIVEINARVRTAAKVVRATIVIDVGRPINLSGVRAQMEGGLAESIALILNAGLTLQNGLPTQFSYNNYRFTKMADFPRQVEIIVMPDVGEPIGGLGEVGLSATSGAIANAWARATGLKPRKFPLNVQPVFAPLPAGQLPPPTLLA